MLQQYDPVAKRKQILLIMIFKIAEEVRKPPGYGQEHSIHRLYIRGLG